MFLSKPVMGWNSWNTFTKDINEQLIMDTADALVSTGLRDAGYVYLTIDDCWSEKKRDRKGMLVASKEKFPHGMKYVADYVHSKGLKFGMYSDSGFMTCAGYPGSFGHEFDDAEYFASVGADLLKYDNCHHTSMSGMQRYNRMAMALKSTGRDIVFSACSWGRNGVFEWCRSAGVDMYRSTGDITDTFESIKDLFLSQKENIQHTGPGCYNDMDMLVTGLKGQGNIGFGKGCTDANYRYHFAAWCMCGCPLIIGADVRNITKENLELLTNKYLLAIDQDIECRPPIFIDDTTGHKDNVICFKHLHDGTYAVGFFNSYDSKQNMELQFYEIGIDPLMGYSFELTDVFTGKNVGKCKDAFTATVNAGDCKVYIAKLVK